MFPFDDVIMHFMWYRLSFDGSCTTDQLVVGNGVEGGFISVPMCLWSWSECLLLENDLAGWKVLTERSHGADHVRRDREDWGWDHSLQWRHNGHDGISNHQPHHCLLNRLFRRRSKKTSKLRATGHLCGEFVLLAYWLELKPRQR